MDALPVVALFAALLCALAWIVKRKRNLWVCMEAPPAPGPEWIVDTTPSGTRMITGTDPREMHALYLASLSRGYEMLSPTTVSRLRRLGSEAQWIVNMACCVHRCKPYLTPYASCAAGRNTRIAIIYDDGECCVPAHLSNWVVVVPPQTEESGAT